MWTQALCRAFFPVGPVFMLECCSGLLLLKFEQFGNQSSLHQPIVVFLVTLDWPRVICVGPSSRLFGFWHVLQLPFPPSTTSCPAPRTHRMVSNPGSFVLETISLLIVESKELLLPSKMWRPGRLLKPVLRYPCYEFTRLQKSLVSDAEARKN